MTTQQIAWASKHDWFQSVQELTDKTIVIWCHSKRPERGVVPFTNIQKLMQWAGY
jgi:hypothetical protein|tara:strand:+ start:201 stop:365 length:165 start_codon:yes stop_codon:yes gene_type:complete